MTQFNSDLFESLYPNIEPIAIIGAGCRYPGVKDPFSFWHKITDGEVLTRPITATDLEKAGVSTHLMNSDHFVLQGSVLESAHHFDAEWFGYTPAETIALDPQQRLFLTCAWEALQMGGGLEMQGEKSQIGVFAAGRMSTYDHHPDCAIEIGLAPTFQYIIGNDKDYLSMRVAYKLGLTGPALTVQTACSSSLVAAHIACEQLRNGECDLALVGGAALSFPMGVGYFYQPGTIISPDGFCRPFDENANGTFVANGVAVVLLKPLRKALKDGDGILAVIRGSAVNNDGNAKIGFTAPSSAGQKAVIQEALALSDVKPEMIGFIEAHATATSLGDLIEVQALTEIFQGRPLTESKCALNSIKANTGHLDVAAGVSSLLTAAFAVKTGLIPPCANFQSPNPSLNLESSPFFIPQTLSQWTQERRFAGVSSFGIGGTNAHMIVESLPEALKPQPETPTSLKLSLSARTEKDMRALAHTHSQVLLDQDLSPDLGRYCATVTLSRPSLGCHLHLQGETRVELIRQLKAFAQHGVEGEGVNSNQKDQECSWHMGNADSSPHSLPLSTKAFAPAPLLLGQDFSSYDVTWESLTTTLRDESVQQGALQDWTSCEEEQRIARELHKIYISHALDQLGIFTSHSHATLADVMSRGRIQKSYEQWVYRLLRDLARSGALACSHGRYSELKLHALSEAEPFLVDLKERGFTHLAEIIKRCGPVLASLLQGHENPVALIFPEATMDHLAEIYENNRNSQFLNGLVAKAIQEYAYAYKSDSSLRILEIGAGTGGTTCAILPIVPADRTSYVFSDIGPLFLEHAKTKFASYPFLSFERYDVNKDPEEQGFKAGTFDLIVASNVLHNAQDLAQILTQIRRLLVPGGLLILRELTQHTLFFDLCFGPLVPELSDMDKRHGEVFLSRDVWGQFLAQSGWAHWDSFPKSDSSASSMGEHVIIAHNVKSRQNLRTRSSYEEKSIPSESTISSPLQNLKTYDTDAIPASRPNVLSSASGKPHLYHMEWHAREMPHTTDSIACILRLEHRRFSSALISGVSIKTLSELKTIKPQDGVVLLDLTEEEATSSTYWHVIQAIRSCANLSLKLCLVTREAQIITPWDKGAHGPLQGLRGLVRVARNEYADLNLRWIDLVSRETSWKIIPYLLTMPNSEDIMAARRGRIFVPRLVHLPQALKHESFPSLSHGRHIITGALSPFARTITLWLVEQGAQDLWLIARRNPSQEEQEALEKLQRLGARIRLWTNVNVSDKISFERVLEEACADRVPIITIFHLPGHLEDALLSTLQEDSLERVLAPKVEGARTLIDWLPRLNPQYIGFSSSASATFGPRELAAHAIANGILEGFAEKYRRAGWPIQTLGWGYWDEGRADRTTLTQMFVHQGMLGLSSSESLALLRMSMELEEPVLLPMKMDWPTVIKNRTEAQSANFLEAYTSEKPLQKSLLEKKSSKEGPFHLWLRTHLSEITKIPQSALDPDANLIHLGVDSLMLLDMTKRIKTTFGLDVPANILFQYNTLRKLSAYIAPKLEGNSEPLSSKISPSQATNREERDTGKSFDLWLRTHLSEITKIPQSTLDPDANLIHLGVDSLMLLDMTKRIKTTFGLDVPANILFQHNTLRKLSAYMTPKLGNKSDELSYARQRTVEA